MKEVLQINVILDRTETVTGAGGEVRMIFFHGTFSCGLGEGEVLAGGVDTQIWPAGKPGTLSARYILAGKDWEGKPFRIYVENSGVCSDAKVIRTRPVIYTDAEALQWMEQAQLVGLAEGQDENNVRIKIYKE